GDRRDAIISAAGEDGVEIVLGREHEPSLLHVATGSTVVGVAAHAPIPVIAVAPQSEVTVHQRIAVGVKDPRRADAIVHRGLEAAAERGASLWIVNAWEMPPGYEALVATPAEREKVARSVTEQLETTIGRLAADFPQVEHKISVVHGNPARTLEEVSQECDLLVLARRAHLLPRGHIGGTARAVLRHAACPVMLVPAG
ncbi:MAG: universal stress protein, partial [Actinomycetes bacterium]